MKAGGHGGATVWPTADAVYSRRSWRGASWRVFPPELCKGAASLAEWYRPLRRKRYDGTRNGGGRAVARSFPRMRPDCADQTARWSLGNERLHGVPPGRRKLNRPPRPRRVPSRWMSVSPRITFLSVKMGKGPLGGQSPSVVHGLDVGLADGVLFAASPLPDLPRSAHLPGRGVGSGAGGAFLDIPGVLNKSG